MGTKLSIFLAPHLWREDEPESFSAIKYDPNFGFEGRERQEIAFEATKEEMDSANLRLEYRDYCVKKRLNFLACMDKNRPFWYKCKGFMSELEHCYYDQRIHDMKEFERERRLNRRERLMAEKNFQ